MSCITTVSLSQEEKEFIDQNHISLTKFLHAKLSELKKSIGSSVEPSPIENQPSGELGGFNGR